MRSPRTVLRRKTWKLGALASAMIASLFMAGVQLLATSADARQLSFKEVARNDPGELSYLFVCGAWKTANQSGIIRVAGADFYLGGSRLWVEWLTGRDARGVRRSVASLPLSEINDDHVELKFSQPICKPVPDGVVLGFEARDDNDGKNYEFTLKLFHEPGKFTVQRLPKKQ